MFVPAQPGDLVSSIQTPALLIDLNAFEENLALVHTYLKKHPNVSCKPHAKSHKCNEIAKLQIESGCTGICVAKLSEAVNLADAGIKSICITNEIVGDKKLDILVGLTAKYPDLEISTCLDNFDNAKDLNRKMKNIANKKIDVLIEVNVGQNRCGLEPGKPVADFLEQILTLENLNFVGILCYQGWNQHIRDSEERKKAVIEVVGGKVKSTLQAIKEANLPAPEIVTGGGTGTFIYEAESGVFNEVQPGSYVFMDNDYNLNGDGGIKFRQSLFLLSSVCSINKSGNFVVLDAGWKSTTMDSGVPVFKDYPEFEFVWGGDEHGMMKEKIASKNGEKSKKLDVEKFSLDDKIWLVPGHCDPTVNLHDWLVGVRDGKVESVWKVDARGPGF